MDIAGGTGISTVVGATDTVTIDLDATSVSAGSYGNSTQVGTFTVDPQGRLTTAANASIAFPAETFTLTADSGSNQTIGDGDTMDIAGGTGISTVVGATDTVTIDNIGVTNLSASPSNTNIVLSASTGNISCDIMDQTIMAAGGGGGQVDSLIDLGGGPVAISQVGWIMFDETTMGLGQTYIPIYQ